MTTIWNKKALENVIRELTNAFSWGSSEEGYDYWQSVIDNLNEIKNEKPHQECPICGSKITVVKQIDGPVSLEHSP